MGWTSSWKAALSDPQLEPIILVDVGMSAWTDDRSFMGLGAGTPFGSTFSSHSYVPGGPAISPDFFVADVRCSGQSVRIRDWTTTHSGFSFALTSSKPGEHNLPFSPARGVAVQVRIGFAGMTSLGFEVVARGTLDGISHAGDTWDVSCRDMWSVIRTRDWPAATAFGDPDQFFNRTIESTTTTGSWTSNSGDNLPVASLNFFLKDARSGAVGVAMIEGDQSADPPRDNWWFVYSGRSATSGAGNLIASGTKDWFGNDTARTYASGSVVHSYGVITGQPWNVAARILRSTGAESSTGFDTLPSAWGVGLPLHMIAADDITSLNDHVAMTTGTDLDPKWTPFVLGPVDDMLQFIQQGLGSFNMFPVLLEDEVSIRMAYDYHAYSDGVIADYIDDDWIATIDGHELYHPDAEVEFLRVGGLQDADGALYSLKGDTPISRPWLEKYEKSIAANGLTRGSANSPDGRTAWEAGTSEAQADARTLTTRAHTWYTRIPEQLKITTVGLRYAALVPGDLVSITSRHIIGREGLYSNTVGMVTATRPDWIRGSVGLEVAVLPTRKTP